MKKLADLHTHSTASDGQYRPGELVELARERGIQVLALTDHDTTAGLEEAMEAGTRAGVLVLPGLELSAREYPIFHILGYCFSLHDPGLGALCREVRGTREDRNLHIFEFLREKGMELTWEEVASFAEGGLIGRPHFARAMVRRGYVETNREAFDRYLDTEEYRRRVERGKPAARRCVEAIKAAGGRASLAHPYQIGVEDGALEEIVRELAGYGLDALECYYPRHTERQTAFYLDLAARYGLHATGGSDFHGERVKPDISLAALELELDWLLGSS